MQFCKLFYCGGLEGVMLEQKNFRLSEIKPNMYAQVMFGSGP